MHGDGDGGFLESERNRNAKHGTHVVLGVALVLALAAFATAPIAPLLDPDEGYYPATAAESLRAGEFWDLRFNDAPRWDKPVLSYALIAAAFVAFGESESAARLPSAIEGVILLLVIGLSVSRIAGSRAGALCSLVAGTSIAFSIFARVAHPEIGVVLSIVTTDLLVCLWLASADPHPRRHLAGAAGVSLAYGMLSKGPVAVVLPALAFLAAVPFVWRLIEIRRLVRHALLAMCVAFALAVPWYVAMTYRHGSAFLYESLWRQNVGRYSAAAYGHRFGSLSLVLPTLIGLLPWTGLLPAACRPLQWRPRTPRESLRLYMLLSAVMAFGFYSLSSSKLPSYAFACVPPLAVVIGLWLDDAFERGLAAARWRIATAVLTVCAAILITAPFLAGYLLTPEQLLGGIRPATSEMRGLLAPLTIPLGLLMAGVALILARAASLKWRLAALATVGVLAPVLFLVAARPTLLSMYPYEAFGQIIASRPGPVWLFGRRAPSLTFYASRSVALVADQAALHEDIGGGASGWLVVTREDWARLCSTDATVRNRHGQVTEEGGRMLLVWLGQ